MNRKEAKTYSRVWGTSIPTSVRITLKIGQIQDIAWGSSDEKYVLTHFKYYKFHSTLVRSWIGIQQKTLRRIDLRIQLYNSNEHAFQRPSVGHSLIQLIPHNRWVKIQNFKCGVRNVKFSNGMPSLGSYQSVTFFIVQRRHWTL